MRGFILRGDCIFDSIGDEPFSGYVAVEGNRIADVGKGPVPSQYLNGKYRVIDCGEKTVLPGFIDSHVHLLFGALELDTVNLGDALSEEAAAQKLYECHKDTDEKEWALGFGWSHYNWPDHKFPTKETLDRYFPNQPVVAFNDELHAAWINSKALEICGITRDTPDPPGGEIRRGPDGEPTGFLLEQPAMEMAAQYAIKIAPKKGRKLVELFMKKAHRMGVTSVGDVHVLQRCGHELCRPLEAEGKLDLRVFFAPPIEWKDEKLLALKKTYCSDRLSMTGAKGFLDGTPLGYTGLLVDDYAGRPGYSGEGIVDPGWLNSRTYRLNSLGISVRLHACGDGAVRMALDAYQHALEKGASMGMRNTIEHVEVIHPDDLPRFRDTGAIASIQPHHMSAASLKEHPIFSILGPERCKLAWPGKSLEKHGAKVAFGTDFPIVDMNPITTLYKATCRTMEDDLPREGWNPQEKFTMAEAVKHCTISGAYVMGMEEKIGTLEVGKLADIVVLSGDLFKIDPLDLSEICNSMTIFDGKILYER